MPVPKPKSQRAKARVIPKARKAYCCLALPGFLHASPNKGFFSAEEKDLIHPCVIVPCADFRQAKLKVRIENMTPASRIDVAAKELCNDDDLWEVMMEDDRNFFRDQATRVLSKLGLPSSP